MLRVSAALFLIVATVACGREFSNGPLTPSPAADAALHSSTTISWDTFVSSRMSNVVADNHLPGPTNFIFLVSGTTVFLGWQPAPGNVSQYVIEAGSASTLSNIAVFGTGSAATTTSVANVPPGVYYARIRALVNGALTAASNEIVVAVGGTCQAVVTPTSRVASRLGGTLTFDVSAPCAWTAASSAPFMTVLSGATGQGNGVVTVAVAPNNGGARVGSLVIAGQVVTVSQGASSIHVAFDLYDPGAQMTVTNECRINANPTRCVLRSTSFTFGTSGIIHYAWTVRYTYGGEIKTHTQSGPSPEFTFEEVCGLHQSAPEGAVQPLNVTLTVTDNVGESATAVSGEFHQPPLNLKLYTCPES